VLRALALFGWSVIWIVTALLGLALVSEPVANLASAVPRLGAAEFHVGTYGILWFVVLVTGAACLAWVALWTFVGIKAWKSIRSGSSVE